MRTHGVFLAACCAVSTSFAFYNPQIGRWTSRDFMEEEGGANTSAYCGNDVNQFDILGLTMNWYYGGYTIINDFVDGGGAGSAKLRQNYGSHGTRLAYTLTKVAGINVKCRCDEDNVKETGRCCWRYLSATVSISDEIHMRPTYRESPSREWVLAREKEHAGDTEVWVHEQYGAQRWIQFESDEAKLKYSSENECVSAVLNSLKDELEVGIFALNIKSYNKWDASGKHTWRSK